LKPLKLSCSLHNQHSSVSPCMHQLHPQRAPIENCGSPHGECVVHVAVW
jgi:hypothetical protein